MITCLGGGFFGASVNPETILSSSESGRTSSSESKPGRFSGTMPGGNSGFGAAIAVVVVVVVRAPPGAEARSAG